MWPDHRHNELSASGSSPSSRGIFILNASKRCESNALLFSRAINFFIVNGYPLCGDIEQCDIILVNSCCVSEDKIAASMAALQSASPYVGKKRIVLLGCLAALLNRRPDLAELVCIGPKDLFALDACFDHQISITDITVNTLPPELLQSGQGLGSRDYYILIAQGCSNNCSYCTIKRAKGGVRSAPIDTVLAEMRRGFGTGVREFSFLADDCGSYGDDCGTDLLQLLQAALRFDPAVTLKLLYLYPLFLQQRSVELLEIFRTGRISFVHIPLQSGSQRLLHLMNRSYDITAVMACIRQLRDISPATRLVTHILVNFPTETAADFRASLAVAAAFDDAIFLHFSENRDTAAAKLQPKIPWQEARKRLDAASLFVNQRTSGSGCVIADFNCTIPYNLLPGEE